MPLACSIFARRRFAEYQNLQGAFWWSIACDPMRRDADRLQASRLLADRGWGKAANFEPLEGDPLGLEDAERAAEGFRAAILRLAPSEPGSS
jgi:hypothetical protein